MNIAIWMNRFADSVHTHTQPQMHAGGGLHGKIPQLIKIMIDRIDFNESDFGDWFISHLLFGTGKNVNRKIQRNNLKNWQISISYLVFRNTQIPKLICIYWNKAELINRWTLLKAMLTLTNQPLFVWHTSGYFEWLKETISMSKIIKLQTMWANIFAQFDDYEEVTNVKDDSTFSLTNLFLNDELDWTGIWTISFHVGWNWIRMKFTRWALTFWLGKSVWNSKLFKNCNGKWRRNKRRSLNTSHFDSFKFGRKSGQAFYRKHSEKTPRIYLDDLDIMSLCIR